MRLLEGRGWLAVAALALRTVAGDRLTFTSGFEGPYPGKAIVLKADAITRKYIWVSDVDVEEIQLYNWENISNNSRLIGSWTSASAPQGANPSSTGPSPMNGIQTTIPGAGSNDDSGIGDSDSGSTRSGLGHHHGRAAQADDGQVSSVVVALDGWYRPIQTCAMGSLTLAAQLNLTKEGAVCTFRPLSRIT